MRVFKQERRESAHQTFLLWPLTNQNLRKDAFNTITQQHISTQSKHSIL